NGFELAILLHHRSCDALACFVYCGVATVFTQHAVIDAAIPIAFDANDAVIFHHDLDRAADGTTITNGFDFGEIFIMYLISAGSVNDCAGWADLNTAPTFDTGAFSKQYIRVRHDHAFCTALGNGQREITSHFSTGTHAAPAEDAAVVIQNKIRM